MLFKTAIFSKQVHPTGVRDILLSPHILQQQWQTLKHAARELLPKH
jgi:hypothetical protein